MNRSSKALIAVVALAAGACETDRRSAADAAASLCVAWLTAALTHQESCQAASVSYLEHQIASLPASCELIHRSVLEGRVRFDRARSAVCTAWLETAYEAAPCDAPLPADPASCRATFRPLVPPGGACSQPADCIDGWCSFPEGTCPRPGVCVPLGGEGDECDPVQIWPSPNGSCRAGYACDWTGEGEDGFTCRTPPAPIGEGSTCGLSMPPCASGLYCRAYGGLRDPDCQPEVGLGEPCPRWDECAAGLVCNQYAVCARYVGEGSSCAEATAVCGDGLFCNDAGVCEAYPEEGEPCSPDRGCLEGVCSTVDSRCHPAGGKTGNPCSDTQPCDFNTHTCNGGVCEPVCPSW